MNLQEENNILKKKLEHASQWMQKDILEERKKIALSHSSKDQIDFYVNEQEDIIMQKIFWFFTPEVRNALPEESISQILWSELLYYHILQTPNIDGIWVIIGYQKVLDSMIEISISKPWRKYLEYHPLTSKNTEDPLEKSLHAVYTKHYHLSIGRLYEILKNIHENRSIKWYQLAFCQFLDKNLQLKKSLQAPHFFIQLQELISMQTLGEKRHSGKVSPEETFHARKIIIGNLQHQDCLIGTLASSISLWI